MYYYFCLPNATTSQKEKLAVGLTFATVPENASEAFMVHSSTSQPAPYTQGLTEVLMQQLYSLSFTQATCKYVHCGCICSGPSLVKDLATSGLNVLCLSVNNQSSAKAEAVAAAYAT